MHELLFYVYFDKKKYSAGTNEGLRMCFIQLNKN